MLSRPKYEEQLLNFIKFNEKNLDVINFNEVSRDELIHMFEEIIKRDKCEVVLGMLNNLTFIYEQALIGNIMGCGKKYLSKILKNITSIPTPTVIDYINKDWFDKDNICDFINKFNSDDIIKHYEHDPDKKELTIKIKECLSGIFTTDSKTGGNITTIHALANNLHNEKINNASRYYNKYLKYKNKYLKLKVKS